MRGVLALARGRYLRRLAELEAEGTRDDAANAVILAESRAADGALHEGESINLSMWSERLAMPRDVLEALVLAITHAEPRDAPDVQVPAPPSPPQDPALPLMTPVPVATRNPPVADDSPASKDPLSSG